MIKKLLTKDAKDRLGTLKDGHEDIVNHPWFASLDFEQYLSKSVKAPWIPPIKNSTDTHLFEAAGDDDHVDNQSINIGGDWDRDF